jgi:hypothetical protein
MNWLLPVIGLILGLAISAFAAMAYSGSPAVATMPAMLRRKGDLLWLVGLELIALALLLGFVGLLLGINLQLVRILLGVIVLVLLGLAWPRGATTA